MNALKSVARTQRVKNVIGLFIKLCTHHWTPERHVPCELKTLKILILI